MIRFNHGWYGWAEVAWSCSGRELVTGRTSFGAGIEEKARQRFGDLRRRAEFSNFEIIGGNWENSRFLVSGVMAGIDVSHFHNQLRQPKSG
jgi:hypothetical protein